MEITDLPLAEIERLERDVILRTLNTADRKISRADGAAALLEMKPTKLTSRVQRMGLKKPDA